MLAVGLALLDELQADLTPAGRSAFTASFNVASPLHHLAPAMWRPPCTALYCLQVKRYDLVIQLSEEGAALGAREIRNASRDTMKEFEQDMALATALAQVNYDSSVYGWAGQGALTASGQDMALATGGGMHACESSQPYSKRSSRQWLTPPACASSLCSAAWQTARFATASPRWPAPASKRPFTC